MRNFWQDEAGGLALEWIFLSVILVLGIIGGIASIRNSINNEAGEVANAAVSLVDKYSVSKPPTLTVNGQASATINGFSH